MRTLKFYLTVLTCVMISVMSSCSTEQAHLNVKTSKISPANPNNPYDEVGVMHNAGLSKTMNEIKASKKNLSIDEIIDISCNNSWEVLSDNGATRGVTLDELEVMTEEEILAMLEDMDNNLDNFINALELSPIAKADLKELVTSVLAMADEEELQYSDIYEKVTTFESNVAAFQHQYSEQDLSAIYCGSSTLRHSLSYWESEYAPTTTSQPGQIQAQAKRRWWKWLIIGVADAAGAIGGATAGTVTTVAGGIAGAVTGAVAASAGAATLVDKL